MKTVGGFLLAKEKNAIIVAFLAALLPVFFIPTGFIAVIITGLVTLQRGFKSGFWLLTWIALPSIAMLALRRLGLFDLLFLRCVLMWLFAGLMHRYRAWNVVLGAILVIGMTATFTVHALVPNATNWWEGHLTAYLQGVIDESRWHFDFTANDFAHQLAPMATGLVAFFLASTLFFELFVARFWQILTVTPDKLDTGFTRIRASFVFIVMPIVASVLAYFKQSWALDLLPVTLFPLCIAGLSFLHFYAYGRKAVSFLLLLVYVGIILIPVLIAAVLSVLAIVDAVFRFRKTTPQKAQSDNNGH